MKASDLFVQALEAENVEYIFGIPGIGQWTIDSIYQRDYNVIMGVQLLSTILVLFGILLTDIAYALVDPRIRYH